MTKRRKRRRGKRIAGRGNCMDTLKEKEAEER